MAGKQLHSKGRGRRGGNLQRKSEEAHSVRKACLGKRGKKNEVTLLQ